MLKEDHLCFGMNIENGGKITSDGWSSYATCSKKEPRVYRRGCARGGVYTPRCALRRRYPVPFDPPVAAPTARPVPVARSRASGMDVELRVGSVPLATGSLCRRRVVCYLVTCCVSAAWRRDLAACVSRVTECDSLSV